jgi:hypothetical protein
MADGRQLSHHDRNRILKHGIAAAATIVETVQAPPNRDGSINVDVQLDVHPDDRPPFRGWARVDDVRQSAINVMQPGTPVLVRFDTRDGATVVDRERTDFLHPDGEIARPAVEALYMQQHAHDFDYDDDDDDNDELEPLVLRDVTLPEPARRGIARIVAAQPMGDEDVAVFHLRLAVHPADGSAAFSTTHFTRASPAQARAFVPGAELDVVYDATNPAVLLVGSPPDDD